MLGIFMVACICDSSINVKILTLMFDFCLLFHVLYLFLPYTLVYFVKVCFY